MIVIKIFILAVALLFVRDWLLYRESMREADTLFKLDQGSAFPPDGKFLPRVSLQELFE